MREARQQAFVVLLLCVLWTCGSCSPVDIAITRPPDGGEVYGIVRLTAQVTGDGAISSVTFYYDTVDDAHLIGTAAAASEAVCAVDWYTADVQNGAHTLYAACSDAGGKAYQASVGVEVVNLTRADTIPQDTVTLTPENDPAPPLLNPDLPALKDIWEDPVPMDGPVNTAGAEDSPFITPDGKNFYFFFTGDVSKSVYEQVDDPMTGIFWSKNSNGEWTAPERVFLNYYDEPSLDGAHTVRGDALWFASARAGNYRDLDMWVAELQNGRWANWTNAGETLNKVYEIGELHVTADESEIYFDSSRAGGKGEKDIWVTRYADGQWQEPENIEAANTEATEGWPYVSEDGTELWFTRAAGSPAVYRSLKVDGQWQEPELILSPLAGEPTLDDQGNLYFVHHAWDTVNNRVAEADIYVCYRR